MPIRRKREEGRGKKEEGRRKREEGRGKREGTTRILTRIRMDKSLSLSQESRERRRNINLRFWGRVIVVL
jgi:hypothetical protein